MKTKELRELLERATKGPWEKGNGNEIAALVDPKNSRNYAPVCQVDDEWNDKIYDANAELIALTPTLAADLIRCRELLAGMVSGAFNDEATELEHTLDCPGEGCTLCEAKKYLAETEG